jgi:hypothetical protein
MEIGMKKTHPPGGRIFCLSSYIEKYIYVYIPGICQSIASIGRPKYSMQFYKALNLTTEA